MMQCSESSQIIIKTSFLCRFDTENINDIIYISVGHHFRSSDQQQDLNMVNQLEQSQYLSRIYDFQFVFSDVFALQH